MGPVSQSARIGTVSQLASVLVETPVGAAVLAASDAGLVAMVFLDDGTAQEARQRLTARLGEPVLDTGSGLLRRAGRALARYFQGDQRRFDLPLDLRGTPFQRRVWAALRRVPFGRTVSYGELAATLGRPRSTRAVAQALGRNPLPIIVPCHRVIRSDGHLGGFSAGLDRKRRLLALEGDQGLPLFAVAARRERRAAAAERGADALGHLPPALSSWLRARLEGKRSLDRAWLEPDQWARAAAACSDARELGALATHIARQPGLAPDHPLARVAADLARWATDPSQGWPPVETLEDAARALIEVDAREELSDLVRDYAAKRRLPREVREALAAPLRDVLRGTLAAPPASRAVCVDLWQLLEPRPAFTERPLEDAGEELTRAGALWEAAAAAEASLARGLAPPAPLRERLVSLYEEVGEDDAAYAHAVALVDEDPSGPHRRLLHRLLERRRSAEPQHAASPSPAVEGPDGPGE